MGSYQIKNVNFAYPNREYDALRNINLSIHSGEFVTLCGKSGCGKTTLLRLLKTSISPFGNLRGEILFDDEPLNGICDRVQASEIGFVMQNPDNQIATDKVWHEIAFGLESLGYSTPEIRTRVSEMASFFGIENWFYKKTSELSGGQKQLLNLASVMVMQPKVLILDEPTSQLDPIASSEFIRTLQKINDEFGTTIILTEHRMEEAFAISDRIIVMDNGEIIADDTPENIGKILKSKNHDMFDALPVPVRVFCSAEDNAECPLTIRDGKMRLLEYSKTHEFNHDAIPKDKETTGEITIEVKDAYFRYEKDLPDVVKGLNMTVHKGEIFAMLGGNGTGKTTALSLVSGLNSPQRGTVYINDSEISKIQGLYDGLLGVLPQNPQSLFARKTVYLDLFDATDKTLSKAEREQCVAEVASLCRIENLLEYHPYDLSGGEQQRTALAMILLKKRQILILDEPTKGMDSHFKKIFAEILNDLKAGGATIFMVSHDIEFCGEYADRCALFFDGNITSVATARKFFKGNNFYTTSANRMARELIPDAILADDIIASMGGEIKPKTETKTCTYEMKTPTPNNTHTPKKFHIEEVQTKAEDRKLSKQTLFAMLSILIAIPLTIFFGMFYLGDRKYYFISLLIILETLLPFFMMFEKRKPQAREIVIISVLCAIAVAGRTAFSMFPEFKPTVAIVIITGLCFGGEAGFLVGAVTAFVSNFFFGQGPWTPWQMFALGIIGFVAGVLFKKGFLRRTRVSVTVFGFLVTLILYGGVMNSASVLMMTKTPSWGMIMSAFVLGLPFDLIHAISSAFFLWFIAEPMIEKLERVKTKYGLIER